MAASLYFNKQDFGMIQVVPPMYYDWSNGRKQLFRKDYPDLAWDILECQANLEVFPTTDGREIANLLSLYMRAVELLNSLQDRRESYFKTKMSNLMLRPTVVKSINTTGFRNRTHQQQLQSQQEEVQVERNTTKELTDRKQHLAVQLAYHNEKHTQDELKRLMTIEYSRQEKLKQKIEELVKDNRQKVQARIDRRRRRARQLRFERYEVDERVDAQFGHPSEQSLLDNSQDSTVVDSPYKPPQTKREPAHTTYNKDVIV